MKGKRFHPNIRERAKQLYTKDGCSPEDIIEALSEELLDGQLQIPDKSPTDIELPKDRSTISRWAKEYGWSPHWQEARKRHHEVIDAAEPFAISGIKDPVFHMARVKALKRVEFLIGEHPDIDDSRIQEAVVMRVRRELEPGRRVLRELRPLISQAIDRVRKLQSALTTSDRRRTIEEEEQWILTATPLEKRSELITRLQSLGVEVEFFCQEVINHERHYKAAS